MELQNDPIRTTFQRFKECRICSRFSIDLADLFYVLSLIRQDAPFAEFSGAWRQNPKRASWETLCLSCRPDLSDKAENSSAVALRIASAGFETRCRYIFESQAQNLRYSLLPTYFKKCRESHQKEKQLLQLLLKKAFIVDLCLGRN